MAQQYQMAAGLAMAGGAGGGGHSAATVQSQFLQNHLQNSRTSKYMNVSMHHSPLSQVGLLHQSWFCLQWYGKQMHYFVI